MNEEYVSEGVFFDKELYVEILNESLKVVIYIEELYEEIVAESCYGMEGGSRINKLRRLKLATNHILKKRVLKEIEELSEEHLVEIRDFVNHLIKTRRTTKEEKPDPERDPILKLIGIADVEPFGHSIDSELYGD